MSTFQPFTIQFFLILLLTCSFCAVSFVHAQYLVATTQRFLPGPYAFRVNATATVNLGHAPTNDAATTTSPGFNLLRSDIDRAGTYYLRVGAVGSSSGDYVIFNSPNMFSISYTISKSFSSFYLDSSYSSYIPAYGTERIYSSSDMRVGSSYTFKISTTKVSSVSLRIGYTFAVDDTPIFSTYSISSSKTASVKVNAPSTSTSYSSYVPFYLHIECSNGALDCGTVGVSTEKPDTAGMVIGIALGAFFLFFIIAIAITIPSVIAAKKKRMMALAAVTASKRDIATTTAVVTTTQPTMPPGAYQPPSTMPPGAYVQPTMPPGAYVNQQPPTTMPPGAYQPIQTYATPSYGQPMPVGQQPVQYQPYVDPNMVQTQPYYQPTQTYGNQPKPAFNPNADVV